MPMPTGGNWPPPNIAHAYEAYRDWDAWYVGNPDDLYRVYQNRGGGLANQALPPSVRARPAQYAGGVLGTISRWLWGAPPPVTARDTRLHVPLPSDLAATSAGLLFSEPPAIVADDKAAQDRIVQLCEDGFHSQLRHAAETASAFGDVYLRPVIDREVSPDSAIVSVVHADGAIPVIRWGRLLEVTFWSDLATDSTNMCMRLLEHHEKGRITYALFQGDATSLGRMVPLTEHPDAMALADVVDADGGQNTGLPDRLDVVRIANSGPQRRWRKQPGLKYLGRSDFDGNEAIFDRVDVAWTGWMQDLANAKGRITVPAYMLQDLGAGQGAMWDPDRAVYSAVNQLPNQTGSQQLTVTQFAIRHVEHKATIDALTEVAMRHAGLSAQTMGEEGDVAMTATEAHSRERMSFVTLGDRIATWRPDIAGYVELHMAVEYAAGMSTVVPVRPVVEFGDSVSESPKDIAQTAQLLRAAELLSDETGVRMIHTDWDDTQVREEVAKIQKQRQGTGEDPARAMAGYAGNGGDDPNDEGDTPPQE